MTLAEFLVQILKTHAQTLQRLAAYFGEEALLEILERAGDIEESAGTPPPQSTFRLQKAWFAPAPLAAAKTSPYAELEGSVREFKLPEVLEFHLWAYPFYRTLIESPLDLKMTIKPGQGGGEALVQEAVTQSKAWVGRMPIRPALLKPVETLAMVPWLRFRAEMFKKIGKRPVGPV